MSGSDNATKPYAVGYAKPPADHKFQKGRSGNPNGRPRKAPAPSKPSGSNAQLDDILLAEALRPIQVRENDKLVELPMIQAVLRSLGVAAVKGHHRSQLALAQMVKGVQEQKHGQLLALFSAAIDYKDEWQAAFVAADRRGEPRPEPVPHPDDIVLNAKNMTVKFNGPVSQDDKAQWDKMLADKQMFLDDIAESEREMPKRGRLREVYEDDIAHSRKIVRIIDGVIPDEATRRQPGFDIDRWRERKGVLAELQAKHEKKKIRPRRQLSSS